MWQHPFSKKTITSKFGARQNRKSPHRGLDYAPKANEIIPAVTAGEVRLIQWSNILGWVVVQNAKDLKTNKTVFIGYSHLSCASHGVNCKGPKVHGKHSPLKSTVVGSKKELAEPIGRVGNTGSASTGPHLHLTISPTLKGVFYGTVYDPEKFIDEQIVEANKPKLCKCCQRPL